MRRKVAAAPNPTGAVGVSEALEREDIINLPGCPVNPVNIVGTLLSYLMFEEAVSILHYITINQIQINIEALSIVCRHKM